MMPFRIAQPCQRGSQVHPRLVCTMIGIMGSSNNGNLAPARTKLALIVFDIPRSVPNVAWPQGRIGGDPHFAKTNQDGRLYLCFAKSLIMFHEVSCLVKLSVFSLRYLLNKRTLSLIHLRELPSMLHCNDMHKTALSPWPTRTEQATSAGHACGRMATNNNRQGLHGKSTYNRRSRRRPYIFLFLLNCAVPPSMGKYTNPKASVNCTHCVTTITRNYTHSEIDHPAIKTAGDPMATHGIQRAKLQTKNKKRLLLTIRLRQLQAIRWPPMAPSEQWFHLGETSSRESNTN